MKIFITGAAGFIGFSLSLDLLKKKHIVYGIDNLDNYYSLKLKKEKIRILKKYKNFNFKKVDISKIKQLDNYLKNKNFDIIFHFAAQAGVRHSIIAPKKYIKSNIKGFKNIISSFGKKKFKIFFYASSSSVYGDTKKFPLKENFRLFPNNLYAKTKVKNESDARLFSHVHKKKLIGLRFFTVYGEWGRPDMLILKLLSHNKKNLFFKLNNEGNHYRDFTYINDVIKILNKLIHKKVFKYDVYNICSSRPIYIKQAVNKIIKIIKYKKIKKIKKNKLEVFKTFGDNTRIKKLLNLDNFTNFKTGLMRTINWYKKKGHKFF